MKSNVTESDFRDAFLSIRPENFTYEGLGVLYEFLTDMEEDTGQELELDVIAICCDFSEDSPADIADNYDIDLSDCETDEEIENAVVEWLNDETMVAGVTSSTIVYCSAF